MGFFGPPSPRRGPTLPTSSTTSTTAPPQAAAAGGGGQGTNWFGRSDKNGPAAGRGGPGDWGREMAGILTGGTFKPKMPSWLGGGGGGGGGGSTEDKELTEMAALQESIADIPGLESDDVSTIMDTYLAEKALTLLDDPDADAPKIGQFVRAHMEEKKAADAQGKLMDPLTMQLFYGQTVGPELERVRQEQLATADQYEQSMGGQGMGNIPPAYRGVLAANQKSMAANMRNVANASHAATSSQPSIDAIFEQLQQANQLRQQQIAAIQQGLIGGGAAEPNPFLQE